MKALRGDNMKKTLLFFTAGIISASFAFTAPAYANKHHGASAHQKHKVNHQKNVRQIQKIKKRRVQRNRIIHRPTVPTINIGLHHGAIISLFFSPHHRYEQNKNRHRHH